MRVYTISAMSADLWLLKPTINRSLIDVEACIFLLEFSEKKIQAIKKKNTSCKEKDTSCKKEDKEKPLGEWDVSPSGIETG